MTSKCFVLKEKSFQITSTLPSFLCSMKQAKLKQNTGQWFKAMCHAIPQKEPLSKSQRSFINLQKYFCNEPSNIFNQGTHQFLSGHCSWALLGVVIGTGWASIEEKHCAVLNRWIFVYIFCLISIAHPFVIYPPRNLWEFECNIPDNLWAMVLSKCKILQRMCGLIKAFATQESVFDG